MMPMGPPPGYNSYWNGMQPCMDGFMAPYAAPMQMMGYGLGPLDMSFASGMPQDPFGMHGYMMPVVPPHRYAIVCLSKLNYCISFAVASSPCSLSLSLPPPLFLTHRYSLGHCVLLMRREGFKKGC